MGKKMGRPRTPKAQALGEVFSARLNADDARTVRRAIDGSGKSQSNWIRQALLEKAGKRQTPGMNPEHCRRCGK